MTLEQVEAGKKWVEQIIMRLAAEYAVPVDNLEWGVSNKDFDRNLLSLVYFLGNKRYIEKFTQADLSDCPKSPDIRKRLENHLRNLIKSKSTQCGKKLGF